MNINQLILGDNLEVMRAMPDESIDLIYLDPPFFSNRNYEVIWGDDGEVRSFKDRWAGGIDHYIAWLKERVVEMHRMLKPTGSLFLHCDWHANADIRVDILDKLFGRNNFRNEIIWCYSRMSANGQKQMNKCHDSIFWYSKGKKWIFNVDDVRLPYAESSKARAGYKKTNLGGGSPKTEICELNEIGKFPEDWIQIPFLRGKERIGYPTQKPYALLERIVKMASNEGDLVLDPFMGGGTTMAVADTLNRRWIGIDQSVQAVKVTELRLQQQTDLFTNAYANSYSLQLHKYDYDTLRYSDAFEFENWIIAQVGGTGNTKQRSDMGIDGKMPDGTPIQVKRQDNIGREEVDKFLSAVQRSDKHLFDKNQKEKKPVGYIVAFSFGKGTVQEVARLKNKENIIINLLTVEEIVPLAKKPTITVTLNELSRSEKHGCEIEFFAEAKSDAGIEFYSWDFAYDEGKGFKAGVIIDKTGTQVFNFLPGEHHIAVKAVDNNGIENIEIIKLKVNGVVKRTN